MYLSKLDPCDQCATNAFCEVDYDLGTAMCRCPEGMIGYAYGPYGKCGNFLTFQIKFTQRCICIKELHF